MDPRLEDQALLNKTAKDPRARPQLIHWLTKCEALRVEQ